MPQPAIPVIPDGRCPDVIIAKDQPEYLPLPAIVLEDGTVITRWHFSLWERLRLLLFGDLWLSVLTFNHPLQPVRLETKCPIRR